MKAEVVFKAKALELARKLQTVFPAKLLIIMPHLENADDSDLIDRYCETVHKPYAERIRSRDEEFFMTTSDLDDPLNVVSALRGFWADLGADNREVVWRYMDVFERLAACWRA